MLIFDDGYSFSISQRHQYINNSIQTTKSKEMKTQRNGNWPDNSITPPFHLWFSPSLGKLEHWCWLSGWMAQSHQDMYFKSFSLQINSTKLTWQVNHHKKYSYPILWYLDLENIKIEYIKTINLGFGKTRKWTKSFR